MKSMMGILLTFVILSISSWYYVSQESFSPLLDNYSLSTTVDTTVSQLHVQRFSLQGTVAHSLTAPLMEHIPKGNIHKFQNPYIVIAQDSQPAWEIRSQMARSLNGGLKIIFKKQVSVHQKPDNKTQESTLKTEKMIYFPQEKKATTNLLVTFEQPGNKIESMGMNAYLDEKRVELLHQARGSYAPSKG